MDKVVIASGAVFLLLLLAIVYISFGMNRELPCDYVPEGWKVVESNSEYALYEGVEDIRELVEGCGWWEVGENVYEYNGYVFILEEGDGVLVVYKKERGVDYVDDVVWRDVLEALDGFLYVEEFTSVDREWEAMLVLDRIPDMRYVLLFMGSLRERGYDVQMERTEDGVTLTIDNRVNVVFPVNYTNTVYIYGVSGE